MNYREERLQIANFPQVYHRCTHGNDRPSFTRLCPTGTLYNQQYFVCDW